MSSRFSRHGTTGYRWPKVCISQPPPVVPPPNPWPATRLYVDYTTDASYNWAPNDAQTRVPLDEVMMTDAYLNNDPPGPATRAACDYDAIANQFTTLVIEYQSGLSGIVPVDPIPQPIDGQPYDSGQLTAARTDGMGEIVGTIRLYT